MKDSKIAWTHHTFNPWMGCFKISPACKHCYAETLVTGRMRLPVWGPPETTERQRTAVSNWKQPLKWNRAAAKAGVRQRVFCASLADVFEAHPSLDAIRADLWKLIEQCTWLDWLLLTKRPENILRMVPEDWRMLGGWPKHVWVGTTVENQATAAARIPALLAVPAVVRFLSCEPQLEEVDLTPWLPTPAQRGLQWVITGGESGAGARPYDLAWARAIVAQCDAAGVPVFVKQMGDNAVMGAPTDTARGVAPARWRFSAHHGADPNEWPADLRRQEFPW